MLLSKSPSRSTRQKLVEIDWGGTVLMQWREVLWAVFIVVYCESFHKMETKFSGPFKRHDFIILNTDLWNWSHGCKSGILMTAICSWTTYNLDPNPGPGQSVDTIKVFLLERRKLHSFHVAPWMNHHANIWSYLRSLTYTAENTHLQHVEVWCILNKRKLDTFTTYMITLCLTANI